MLPLVNELLQLPGAAAEDKCWDVYSRLQPVSEADEKDRRLARLLAFLGSVSLSFPGDPQWRVLLLTVLEVTGQ